MYTSLDAFASDVRRIAMNCELLYGGGIHSRPDIVAEASALVYRFESMLAAGNAFGLTSAVRDRRLARGVCARARARSFCKTNAPRAHTLTFLSFAGLSLSLVTSPAATAHHQEASEGTSPAAPPTVTVLIRLDGQGRPPDFLVPRDIHTAMFVGRQAWVDHILSSQY